MHIKLRRVAQENIALLQSQQAQSAPCASLTLNLANPEVCAVPSITWQAQANYYEVFDAQGQSLGLTRDAQVATQMVQQALLDWLSEVLGVNLKA
jgi:hypothetical protein